VGPFFDQSVASGMMKCCVAKDDLRKLCARSDGAGGASSHRDDLASEWPRILRAMTPVFGHPNASGADQCRELGAFLVVFG
jgi:hypothetical protein